MNSSNNNSSNNHNNKGVLKNNHDMEILAPVSGTKEFSTKNVV